MTTKPLDKMTKPELVKALKAAHKRIAKLERAEDMRAITDNQVAQSEVAEEDWQRANQDEVSSGRMFPWNDKPEDK